MKRLKRTQRLGYRLSTDDLIGKEYPTSKGGILTVIGDNGLTGNKKKLKLICSLCNTDKEMFPDYFYSTKINLDVGQTPCGCGKHVFRTNRQIILNIKRKVEETDYTLKEIINLNGAASRFIYTCPRHGDTEVSYNNFINHEYFCKGCGKDRFIDEVIKKRICKIKEECDKRGYIFVRYIHEEKIVKIYCNKHENLHECLYDNFIFKETSCPKCSIESAVDKNRIPYSIFLNRISERCKLNDFTFNGIIGEYNGSSSKLSFSCPAHGEKFASYRNFVSNGTGCNECMRGGFNINKSGYFYISKWMDGDTVIGKYGITNRDPEIRMKEQSRCTGYIPLEINSVFFDNGKDALDLENMVSVKWNVNRGILTEKDFSDGFTETVNEIDYINIYNLLKGYKNENC